MVGVKHRSGGRNKKPLRLHALEGTFRADRHPTSVAGTTTLAPAVPPTALLAGLGPDGRGFMKAAFREYDVTVFEGHVLKLAAHGVDDAASARAANDLKAVRAAVRQVLGVLQRLGLPAPDRW